VALIFGDNGTVFSRSRIEILTQVRI